MQLLPTTMSSATMQYYGHSVTISAQNWYNGNLLPHFAIRPIETIPIKQTVGINRLCWHANNIYPCWFLIDLGVPMYVSYISFYPLASAGAGIAYCSINKYEVLVSDDGILFNSHVAKDYTPTNTVRQVQVCNEETCQLMTTTRFIKINILSGAGYPGLTCLNVFTNVGILYITENKEVYKAI